MKHVVDTVKLTLALILAAGLFTLMAPAALHASGQLVTIVDRDSATQTQVDSGKLRVGDGNGAMTVNGIVGASFRGRAPYQDACLIQASSGDSTDICEFGTVPAGTTLIITQITASICVLSGQLIHTFEIDFESDDPDGSVYIGYDQATTQDTESRRITYSHHTELPIGAGDTVEAYAVRNGTDGTMFGHVTIFGYLTTP